MPLLGHVTGLLSLYRAISATGQPDSFACSWACPISARRAARLLRWRSASGVVGLRPRLGGSPHTQPSLHWRTTDHRDCDRGDVHRAKSASGGTPNMSHGVIDRSVSCTHRILRAPALRTR